MTGDLDEPAFAWRCDDCGRRVPLHATETVGGVLTHVLPGGRLCGAVRLVEVD